MTRAFVSLTVATVAIPLLLTAYGRVRAATEPCERFAPSSLRHAAPDRCYGYLIRLARDAR